MKPCRSIAIAAAFVAFGLIGSDAQADLSGRFFAGGGPGDDIIIGDRFALTPAEVVSSTVLRATVATNMSGIVQNPLFQDGSSASNPFFNTPNFTVEVHRIKVRFTWDAAGTYLGMETATDMRALDPLNPTGPSLSLVAKGSGTKRGTPPPPPPDTINGGTGDDIILGDYIVHFDPNQPWIEPDSSPSSSYLFARGSFEFAVVPEPTSAVLLGATAFALRRRR